MATDRSGRVLVASLLFLLAVLLATNYMANGAEFLTYALPLALVFLGLAILFLKLPKRRAAAEASDQDEAAPAPYVREYLPAAVEAEAAPAAVAAELPAAAADIPAAAETAADAPRDDLAVIDGIGPKIANALYEAGITTYSQLAEVTPEALQALLSEANVRVVGRVESSLPTWPAQARFAAQGDFPGLMRYIAERKRSSGDD